MSALFKASPFDKSGFRFAALSLVLFDNNQSQGRAKVLFCRTVRFQIVAAAKISAVKSSSIAKAQKASKISRTSVRSAAW